MSFSQALGDVEAHAPAGTATVAVFKELLAVISAMSTCYQTLHWTAKGSQFMGDHLLFERLYNETSAEVDGIAEKALGLTHLPYLVDASERVKSELVAVNAMMHPGLSLEGMLQAERAFCGPLVTSWTKMLQDASELTQGVQNFLQGLADAHESHVYLLQQRVSL